MIREGFGVIFEGEDNPSEIRGCRIEIEEESFLLLPGKLYVVFE